MGDDTRMWGCMCNNYSEYVRGYGTDYVKRCFLFFLVGGKGKKVCTYKLGYICFTSSRLIITMHNCDSAEHEVRRKIEHEHPIQTRNGETVVHLRRRPRREINLSCQCFVCLFAKCPILILCSPFFCFLRFNGEVRVSFFDQVSNTTIMSHSGNDDQ